MNGLPIIEAYSRPDAKSTVALLPVILLGFLTVFFFAKGITLVVFPAFQMLRLEFSDRRKPVQIQLTNLDKPVETLYKLIVERVEL